MHYQNGKNRDQVFITSLNQMVDADSWARVVDVFVDAMPIDKFGFKNSQLNKEGNLPYHPADLFKLLLYGYRRGIRSANKLHDATKINVEVMWLMKGLRPSPRKICYFRSQNTKAIEKAHRFFVKLLKNWNLIDGSVLAVDGTKINAQNSLKNHFNQKKLDRHLTYINQKIDDYLDQLDDVEHSDLPSRTKQKKINKLKNKINDHFDRIEASEDIQKRIDDSHDGQVAFTDPDAKMVIKKRGITEVGYNIQATADSKYNMIVDVFAGGVNDNHEFGKAARRAQDLLDMKYIDMLADKGYYNGIEIAYAERRGVRPFISPKGNPPQKEVGFRKQDFRYNVEDDMYMCPAGNALHRELEYKKGTPKRRYKVRRYGTTQCAHCPLRTKCTTAQAGRKIERPIYQPYVDRNNKRVTRYNDFYRLRQQIIEHIFGTLKRQWGIGYTLLKGKENVETEFRLAAICYNLNRSMSILGIHALKARLLALICTFIDDLRDIIMHLARLLEYENDFGKKNNIIIQ
jgi:transposase